MITAGHELTAFLCGGERCDRSPAYRGWACSGHSLFEIVRTGKVAAGALNFAGAHNIPGMAEAWRLFLDSALVGWTSACHPCREHVPRWMQCDDYRREISQPLLSEYDRSKPRHRVPVRGLPRARCCDV